LFIASRHTGKGEIFNSKNRVVDSVLTAEANSSFPSTGRLKFALDSDILHVITISFISHLKVPLPNLYGVADEDMTFHPTFCKHKQK
jgi:hypothetical protein